MSLEHDERPWGNYTVLDQGVDYKVKRITVHAGMRLSYQRHARREEHRFVIDGASRVTLEGRDFDAVPGTASRRPRGSRPPYRQHRTTQPLTFLEVQRGDYLGEDDIVRLDDDYGRADGTP